MDLLERLRQKATLGYSSICLEAADEIERLRAVLFQVANDSRCFTLHERTKTILKEWQIVDGP